MMLVYFLITSLLLIQSPIVSAQETSLECLNTEIRSIIKNHEDAIVSVISYNTNLKSSRVSRKVSTGFIIENGSFILTTIDGVTGADSIIVIQSNGNRVKASLVGRDILMHLALLKPESTNLPSLKISSSGDLQRGDLVLAIGNTFGFQTSAALGIISGFDISIQSGGIRHDGLIQVNTQVAPGSIGAAIFDTRGEVVGMLIASSAKFGAGFAIPGERLIRSVKRMEVEKEPKYAYLGVIIQDILNEKQEKKVEVINVDKGSPADKAGLEPGDIIDAYSGNPVKSSGDLRDFVAFATVGSRVELSITRNGEKLTKTVLLSEIPQDRLVELDSKESSGYEEPDMNELCNRLKNAEAAIKELERRQKNVSFPEPVKTGN